MTIVVPEFSYARPPFRSGGAPAIAECALQLEPGVHALLGRNGAGKSTLFGIIAGTLKAPVSVRASTGPIARQPLRAMSGLLPQCPGFPPMARVSDFVAYAAWLKGVPHRDALNSVHRALQLANVEMYADKRCKELSGGTLRRVHLAAALVHRPALLLLDEPTAGLDPMERSRFHKTIESLPEGTFVLMATHLLEDVAASANRVTLLDRGEVVWTGTPEDLGSGSRDVEALRAGMGLWVSE